MQHLDAEQSSLVRQHFTSLGYGAWDPIEIKMVIIGAGGAGKQSLLARIMCGYFTPNTLDPFRGESFGHLTLKVCDFVVKLSVDEVRVEIEHTVGPGSSAAVYMLHHSDAAILLYRGTTWPTLDVLKRFYGHWRMSVPAHERERKKLFVVAGSSDLLSDWEVPLAAGQRFSDRIGADFVTASAKTGEGCGHGDVADMLARVLLHKAETARAEEKGMPTEVLNNGHHKWRRGIMSRLLQHKI